MIDSSDIFTHAKCTAVGKIVTMAYSGDKSSYRTISAIYGSDAIYVASFLVLYCHVQAYTCKYTC